MQATATANKAINAAVRTAARNAITQHANIYSVFTEKRVSTATCNIAGRQCKFWVSINTDENQLVTAVQLAVQQFNCTAVMQRSKYNTAKKYIKVLRNN